MFNLRTTKYDAKGGGGSGSDSTDNQKSDEETSQTTEDQGQEGEQDKFAVWLSKQSTEVQKMYDEHTHGLTSALKKEREKASELPALKKQLKTFAEKEADALKAQMTKEEALASDLANSQASVAALKASLDQLRITNEVERVAASLHFANAQDAQKLLPTGIVKLEDDKVVGAQTALEQLAKEKPYLLVAEKSVSRAGSFTGKRNTASDDSAKEKPRIPSSTRL